MLNVIQEITKTFEKKNNLKMKKKQHTKQEHTMLKT